MFTEKSKDRLKDAHIDLQRLAYELEKIFPNIQVTCSYRGKEDQEEAFRTGKSKAHFGESPHNYKTALALDFVFINKGKPDWDVSSYQLMIIESKKIAQRLGLKFTYGGEFKSFKDYPHIEISNWKQLKH